MVKVYAADIMPLSGEVCFHGWMRQIDEERRRHIDNYSKPADKMRSLAAGILLQTAWEEFNVQRDDGNTAANKLVLRYGKEGKPYCDNSAGFYFNLSHSGDYAVCAVSQGEVGIDIQKRKEFNWKVAERFFAKEETVRLKDAQEADKNRIFNEIWTLKESYIKYTGRGMNQELGSFYLDGHSGIIIGGASGETVFAHQYHDIAGYQITVCSQETEYLENLLMLAL